MDAGELKAHEGRLLVLRFRDGYAAVVRLIDVDPGCTGAELICDVVEVLDWGPIEPAAVNHRGSHTAPAGEVASYRVLPEKDLHDGE